MSKSLRIAVAGCAGRMGRTLLTLIAQDPDLELAGGFEYEGSPDCGKPLSDFVSGVDASLKVESSIDPLKDKMDALIDFTTPFATIAHVNALTDQKTPVIIGTTGFKPEQLEEVREAAKKLPIVLSGNMSLGVNLLMALVKQAANSLSEDFDIEIHEAHHRYKVDAPSGTALMLGEAAAEGRNVDLGEKSVRVRDGIMAERERGQIGFSVTRAGGIIGDHSVVFGSDDEIITLSHHAMDRSLFASGALRAAKWLSEKEAGLYSMQDVLGLGG